MTDSSLVMCAQDFVELLTADIRKLSPKQKAEFRNGWIRAMQRRMTMPKVGQFVLVQLDGGRIVEAVVKAVHEETTGTKVQVSFGSFTAKVGVEQILKQQ